MDQRARRKKVIVIIGIACLLGGGYAILCMQGIVIPCIFHEVTGLKCPGCGVTHMCLSLLRLDFAEAFAANQALFVLLPLFVFYAIKISARYVKSGSMKFSKFDNIVCFSVIVILIVFAIVRNLYSI